MRKAKRMNIVLIDDHVVVSNALKGLVEKLGPYKISNQFNSGNDFLSAIPIKPNPDLIILDLSMPVMGGDEVIKKLNDRGSKIPILILTAIDEEEMVIKLFKLGIKGYLMKNCGASELKKAIDEIFQSGFYHNEFSEYPLHINSNGKIKTILNENLKGYMLFRAVESGSKVNIKVANIQYVKTEHNGRQNKYVMLKGGITHVLADCSFDELLEASSKLVRVNKSEVISLDVFEGMKSDLITLKINAENGKPKQVYLNRWFKKDFIIRLSGI
jgi:DNA-binding NarL/FixJ family response regulator